MEIINIEELKPMDLIELENNGWFYQLDILDDFMVEGDQVIDKPTSVYDYEDCSDTWYSYVYKVEDVIDKITAVYRKVNGELKQIYKRD